MTIKFNFSCDETEILLQPFIGKGYDGTCKVSNIVDNSSLTTIHVIKKIPLSNMHFWYSDLPKDLTIENNKLHIPKQEHACFESPIIPTEDKFVFSNLKNVSITNIVLKSYEDDVPDRKYVDEREMVIDLMLGRLTVLTCPFTPKWIDFYDKHKELARDYMEKHNKQAEDFMTTLVDGNVKFIKVGEVNTSATI